MLGKTRLVPGAWWLDFKPAFVLQPRWPPWGTECSQPSWWQTHNLCGKQYTSPELGCLQTWLNSPSGACMKNRLFAVFSKACWRCQVKEQYIQVWCKTVKHKEIFLSKEPDTFICKFHLQMPSWGKLREAAITARGHPLGSQGLSHRWWKPQETELQNAA